MPENAVLPQTHLIRYVPKTQNILFVLPEMAAIKDPLTIDIGYLTFGIFICDRNSNISWNRVRNLFLTTYLFSISAYAYVFLNFL